MIFYCSNIVGIIFIGINVLAVPPRSRKTRRSVGSCEDLTDLVRKYVCTLHSIATYLLVAVS